eukprot:2256419-Rhodomonas_salina.1
MGDVAKLRMLHACVSLSVPSEKASARDTCSERMLHVCGSLSMSDACSDAMIGCCMLASQRCPCLMMCVSPPVYACMCLM